MEERAAVPRKTICDWLLVALVFALPFMKPPVLGEVIVADLLFLLLISVLAIEVARGRRKLIWNPGFGALAAYVAGLAPSLLASTSVDSSLFKFATEFYLIGLTAATAWIVDSEAVFRRVVLAWIAATGVVSLVAVTSLFAFWTGLFTPLLHYSSYDFGTLPPGPYPRLGMTFVFADMACNYLTVSFALLLLGYKFGYIGGRAAGVLLTGAAIASASTISPGLGGIALLVGLWLFLQWRGRSPALARASLIAGTTVAVAFVVALTVTPIFYTMAPFRIELPGGLILYPSARFLVWSAALEQFVRHPLVGIGIGIDPVHVLYRNPSGFLEHLADAHNIFLSIAAQCGIAGLLGLAAIIRLAILRTSWRPRPDLGELRRLVLGATFLDVFVYQGLGGSFEDTRHIWVLLGLLLAAGNPQISRPDGSSRKAAEPSRG